MSTRGEKMQLVIIGAGGHGQVVREVAMSLQKYITSDNEENIIFLDDRYKDVTNVKQKYGTIFYSIKGMCNEYQKYINQDTEFYPALGDNRKRLEWEEKIDKAGGKLATIIHPTAYIAKSAVIRSGTVIFPNAVINTGCMIGNACIINMGAIIDHGSIIDDACHIDAGAIVLGENHISRYTKIESGKVVFAREFPINMDS